jgi:UDP-3-O-[3-hydroxymyristoyl] glucosamine N-acyltransferase
MPFNLKSSNNDPLSIGVPVSMSSTLGVTSDTSIGGDVIIGGDNTVTGNVSFGKLTCGSDGNSVTSSQFSKPH